MASKFNKELFMELANMIKDDMALYVNTEKEMEAFIQEYPEQYRMLLKKARAALELATSGGSFESLSKEEMQELQGAGYDNDGTTAVCMIAGITIGVWNDR